MPNKHITVTVFLFEHLWSHVVGTVSRGWVYQAKLPRLRSDEKVPKQRHESDVSQPCFSVSHDPPLAGKLQKSGCLNGDKAKRNKITPIFDSVINVIHTEFDWYYVLKPDLNLIKDKHY